MCALVLASIPARGGPVRTMVDPRALDAHCRALVEVPLDARTIDPAIAADLSAASCLAEERTRALTLAPCQASVDALNEAIEPSLGLYDAVAGTGDPRGALLAEHAKADLYAGLAVRFMALAPPLPEPVTVGGLEEQQQAVAELDRLAQPWRDRAAAAFAEVERLGARYPACAPHDPVVETAIADRRGERTTGVARR
ncbi:MAG TPA: hypothetical protein VMJ10_18250 [Kofleriaceae bacterium]|nr:hypothetical protein [Kofleriaceae bacterium]